MLEMKMFFYSENIHNMCKMFYYRKQPKTTKKQNKNKNKRKQKHKVNNTR